MLRMKIEEKLNNLHSLNRSYFHNVNRNQTLLDFKNMEMTDLYQKLDQSLSLVQNVKADKE